MNTYFTTDDLHPKERLARWTETVSRFHAPCLISSENAHDFRACLHVLELGEVRVSALRTPPVQIHRTSRLIQRTAPERYGVNLILNTVGEVFQDNRRAKLDPDRIVIADSSRPFRGHISSPPDGTALMVIQVPWTSLRLGSGDVARITSLPFSAATGIAAVLSNHLDQLMRHAHEYSAVDELDLAQVTVDLVDATCAHQLRTRAPQTPRSRQQALLAEILGFIQQRLGDPDLCPQSIAAAHQISTRYLHKLFRAQGTTAASWIRQRRLAQCRRDLADPRLGTRPVYAIARRWGFTDGAHFSRLFRAAYGTSPKDYRDNALQGAHRDL